MKKVNPRSVGIFVIGAVLISLAAVILFGGARLLETRQTFVAFFPDSLMGLQVGAPVQMRGIQIGTVTDIWVEMNLDELEFMIPVIMEIEVSRIRGSNAESADDGRMDALIEKGFRAQLATQSLVTGQQSIQLNFHPNAPTNLMESDLPYRQIPTIPSEFAEVVSSVDDLTKNANVVLAKVSQLLSEENQRSVTTTLDNTARLSEELVVAVRDLRSVLGHADQLVSSVNTDFPKLQRLVETGRETLVSYKSLADRADEILAENEPGIKKAIEDLHNVELKLATLADTANQFLGENKEGVNDFVNSGLYEFSNLAIDAQAAVEQFRRVMEEMERDPARYFLGRPRQVEVE